MVRPPEASGERARLSAAINTVAPDPVWFKDVKPFDRETDMQAVHELFEDPGLAAILEKIPGFDGIWPATMAYLAAHYDDDEVKRRTPAAWRPWRPRTGIRSSG